MSLANVTVSWVTLGFLEWEFFSNRIKSRTGSRVFLFVFFKSATPQPNLVSVKGGKNNLDTMRPFTSQVVTVKFPNVISPKSPVCLKGQVFRLTSRACNSDHSWH